ncbi:MAG TPA: hypothetical protein VIY48_11255, partial [Candidatus Paceibacterota bacterium]
EAVSRIYQFPVFDTVCILAALDPAIPFVAYLEFVYAEMLHLDRHFYLCRGVAYFQPDLAAKRMKLVALRHAFWVFNRPPACGTDSLFGGIVHVSSLASFPGFFAPIAFALLFLPLFLWVSR